MGFLEDFYAAAQQSVSHRDSIGEGKAGRGRCEAPLHRDVILRAGKRMQTRGGGCIAVANAFTRSGLRQIQQSDSHLHSCGVSDFLRLLLLQPLREKKKKKKSSWKPAVPERNEERWQPITWQAWNPFPPPLLPPKLDGCPAAAAGLSVATCLTAL